MSENPETGMVKDYADLAPFGRYIDEDFDHRHLNDVMGKPQLTTAEALARHFFEWACSRLVLTGTMEIAAVTVKETRKTSATHRAPAKI